MSQVKSPQQLCGKILKLNEYVNNRQQKKVRFVTIMPCYDKKLEAVRPKINLKVENTDFQMDASDQIPENNE